jgi:hypothetical protein
MGEEDYQRIKKGHKEGSEAPCGYPSAGTIIRSPQPTIQPTIPHRPLNSKPIRNAKLGSDILAGLETQKRIGRDQKWLKRLYELGPSPGKPNRLTI